MTNQPAASQPSTALPAEPRLEQIDRQEGMESANAYEIEASKLATLNSYGPTGEEGFVHIPIGRALELLEGKLPARKEPSAEQRKRQNGLVDGGGPNSGRLFREEPRWYER